MKTDFRKLHLVIGAGGTRAFLTGMGAVTALRLSGLQNWATIGGVSGGSIPALFMAAGLSPIDLIDRLLDIDFRNLLRSSSDGVDEIEPGPRARHFFTRWMHRGALHTDRLGQVIESIVKEWPENFWTMAVSDKSHVLFTSQGVFEYGFDGSYEQISEEPAPIGLAIRATCAIPGLLEAVHYKGRYLWDGGMSPFGGCPVDWVRRHFLAESDTIVRCRAIGKVEVRDDWVARLGRRLLCSGSNRVEAQSNSIADINIVPQVPEFSSLRFSLTPEQKKLGLFAGFRAACEELFANGILEGEHKLLAACGFDDLSRLARQHA